MGGKSIFKRREKQIFEKEKEANNQLMQMTGKLISNSDLCTLGKSGINFFFGTQTFLFCT